ncbi:hypothetical protein SFRURICE_012189 [Spodoptera frugiperda]|uniref:SFRICE_016681 n=1 Tax=Spodoptera frugiperda TaxID=7108 RepID=A0A2H1X0V8_SPOFR|nr:hypothetical protein SFRURICE_012189 [Spodoptera frugiperda]
MKQFVLVKQYNDMLIALDRTKMRTRRWYLSIFSQLLVICVNNAWLMYRRDNFRKVDKTTIKDLNPDEKNKKPKRPRPVDDIKYDNIDHFLEHGTEYGRCAYCKKGFTTVFCLKCKQGPKSKDNYNVHELVGLCADGTPGVLSANHSASRSKKPSDAISTRRVCPRSPYSRQNDGNDFISTLQFGSQRRGRVL